MIRPRVIAILTDFGLSDPNVGIMKGVIARINPRIHTIDISHQIPPQDIRTGSFVLATAFSNFPRGTVFLAVVDPGVGSLRRAIAVKIPKYFLVGPDNGLFSGVFEISSPIEVVELTNSKFWYNNPPSATFHGRDIFAPVAAHLANGTNMKKLGNMVDANELVRLPLPKCEIYENEVVGIVQNIDHFGNLITNIPGMIVQGKKWQVQIGKTVVLAADCYSAVPVGSPLALIGSHGFIEIGISRGSARETLAATVGTPVKILLL